MSGKLLIKNCRLFNKLKDKNTTCIFIENGTITQIGQIESMPGCNILDAQGQIAAPGFIDIHIQGAGGADVLDGTVQALQTISKTCARFGTTSFLATSVFKANQENNHLKIAAKQVGCELGGANLLGIHLEGPFISPEKRGMVSLECLHPPSLQVLDEIQEVIGGQLKMMTIAPELSGSLQIIQNLVESNIIASFGHSNAGYEQTLEGFEAGISHVTHLFNAMAPFHHRLPGPLMAIFEKEKEDVTCQLITDGMHIHPAVVKFTFATLGPNRIITITDGMRAMGLGDGKYTYNGIEYESKEGVARCKDGTLIGTSMGLSQLLHKLTTFADCPFDVAIKTVTEKPAKLLGLEDKKGSIEQGKDGDIVILDEDFSVHSTVVSGKIVFQK